jgi:hypothetical protein
MCWKRQAIYQTLPSCTTAADLQVVFAEFVQVKLSAIELPLVSAGDDREHLP